MTTDPNLPVATSQWNDGKPWALAVHITYLISLPIVGVIIAYVKRADFQGTIWETHLTYAIRTFWIGAAGILLGIILMVVLVGFIVFWVVGIWYLIRSIVGLVQAASDKPITNPQTWLI